MPDPPVPILLLLPAFPVGGAERQMADLVMGLDPNRFRMIVACQHGLGPIGEELRESGVPLHLLSDRRRFDAMFLARTVGLIRRESVRLVLSHGFSTGVAGRIAAVLGGAPVRIVAEHSTGERDMSALRHRVNRMLRPWTTAWVSVARGQRSYLIDTKGIPPDRIHVIPNGIDATPFAPAGARNRIRSEFGIPDGAPVAGMLAVLRPEKDAGTFLLAARFVADELPEARFLLVGDGPERADLEREIRALDLSQRAILAGRRRDVADVLTAFDVSVLCSTDVETFPMAFLESMASGLPLIGTRVGGLPEMIAEERNGLLVRPRDPRGLADALLRVLSDPELGRRWGRASRERVETEFTRERMVRAYDTLFTDLLRRAGIPLDAS